MEIYTAKIFFINFHNYTQISRIKIQRNLRISLLLNIKKKKEMKNQGKICLMRNYMKNLLREIVWMISVRNVTVHLHVFIRTITQSFWPHTFHSFAQLWTMESRINYSLIICKQAVAKLLFTANN